MDEFYNQIFSNTNRFPKITLGGLFKIPLVILLIGNLFYAFMLVLKIRVMIDTFNSPGNSRIKTLTYVNLGVSAVGAVLGIVLILLG